jgi:hypothetical protein
MLGMTIALLLLLGTAELFLLKMDLWMAEEDVEAEAAEEVDAAPATKMPPAVFDEGLLPRTTRETPL